MIMTLPRHDDLDGIVQALSEARATVAELETMKRAVLGRKRLKADHGSDSGYYAHRRQWKTEPCVPCKDAHAEAERRRLSK